MATMEQGIQKYTGAKAKKSTIMKANGSSKHHYYIMDMKNNLNVAMKISGIDTRCETMLKSSSHIKYPKHGNEIFRTRNFAWFL